MGNTSWPISVYGISTYTSLHSDTDSSILKLFFQTMQLPTNHFSSSQPVSSTTLALTSVRRSFTLLSWTCYHQLKKFLGWSYSCKDDSETWMCASEIIIRYNWKLVLELTGISVLIKINKYQRGMINMRCGRDNVTEAGTGRSGTGVEEMGDRPHSNPSRYHLPSHPHETFLWHLPAFPHVLSPTSCPSPNFLQQDSKLSRLEKLASRDLSLSIDTQSVTSKQSIFTYSLRIFSGRQNSKQNILTHSPRAAVLSSSAISLDSNNFPPRDANQTTANRRFHTKFYGTN